MKTFWRKHSVRRYLRHLYINFSGYLKNLKNRKFLNNYNASIKILKLFNKNKRLQFFKFFNLD
jgi:hypothetical protein